MNTLYSSDSDEYSSSDDSSSDSSSSSDSDSDSDFELDAGNVDQDFEDLELLLADRAEELELLGLSALPIVFWKLLLKQNIAARKRWTLLLTEFLKK